jgi:hypothetical protein
MANMEETRKLQQAPKSVRLRKFDRGQPQTTNKLSLSLSLSPDVHKQTSNVRTLARPGYGR